MSGARLRFCLVFVARQPHALPPGACDAEATLCGLPMPGMWALNGFTCQPDSIGCEACRARAEELVRERRWRVEATYNGVALVAPSGTVTTVYPPGQRAQAEEDADRLSAPDAE